MIGNVAASASVNDVHWQLASLSGTKSHHWRIRWDEIGTVLFFFTIKIKKSTSGFFVHLACTQCLSRPVLGAAQPGTQRNRFSRPGGGSPPHCSCWSFHQCNSQHISCSSAPPQTESRVSAYAHTHTHTHRECDLIHTVKKNLILTLS